MVEIKKRKSLQSKIYNHLGCCERKLNKLAKAKKYFENSLKHDIKNKGLILLNLSSLTAQMKEMSEAYDYGLKSKTVVQD